MSTQSITRKLLATGLLFGSAFAFSPAAFAGTTGSVTLGGTVTTTLSITTAATAGASALTLGSGTEQIAKVADLTMTTNNEQGLTLTATSGNLTKAGGTSIPFQVVTVVDAASAPATGDFTVASGTSYTVGSSAAGDFNRDLYIKYTPAALQDPGAYSGTINLSVADN